MPKHTTKNQAGGLALEEIYNMLMYDIEPELMTDKRKALANGLKRKPYRPATGGVRG